VETTTTLREEAVNKVSSVLVGEIRKDSASRIIRINQDPNKCLEWVILQFKRASQTPSANSSNADQGTK
jgi:hypothetical protein